MVRRYGEKKVLKACSERPFISIMSNVASIILEQVGRGALFMLGAHTLVSSENSLTFRIKGCTKINCIKIELDASDTYSMTFYKVGKVRGMLECREIASESMVYVDRLHRTIETHTKLRTKL